MNIDQLTHQAILYDNTTQQWLHFTTPHTIITAWQLDEVLDGLRQVETAVEQEGLYAAGFVAYEAAPAFDPGFVVHPNPHFPLLWFGLYDRPQPIPLPAPDPAFNSTPDWVPSITAEQYQAALHRIKTYIHRGDTYQVNFSFRLQSAFSADPWLTFLQLLGTQAPPFGGFLATADWAICSASPELFFRLKGNRLESRPMKGTAPRGLWLEDDRLQANTLRASVKNQAENLMIADMVRNDMGQIAEIGSVTVPSLFALEKYPTLWQMTTTVEANTSVGLADIFQAMFPPASITGAPKARTMQIIAELETTPRQIYTGSIGFVFPQRQAQFNVAIRTLLIDRTTQQAEYGIGGGIVWDSDPNQELQECWTKAQVLTNTTPEFQLLETLKWTPEAGYFLLDHHLTRLCQSACYFDYPCPREAIEQALHQQIQSLPPLPHKVRLLLAKDGSFTLTTEPLPPVSSEILRVTFARSPISRNHPFLYHKTTQRQIYQQARAACPEFDDVLLYNEQGEVTESTIANLVVELGGTLYTPSLTCGLLPGTHRAWLLEQGKIKEKTLTIEQVLHSTQVFLLNSVRGMYRVEVVQSTANSKSWIGNTQ